MKELDPIHKVEIAIERLRAGGLIVLVDDKDREDEGDLVCLGEFATAEIISFMMNEGKGLICASIHERKRIALGIPFQVQHNEATFGTNFGAPFNFIGVSDSGVSATSRAQTIQEISKDSADSIQISSPGYVVPVVGKNGGVLSRRGQTEGSLDLARLATGSDVAVICEILASDGTVLRGNKLKDFCIEKDLPICSIEDIVQYRKQFDVSVREVISRDTTGLVSVENLREALGVASLSSIAEGEKKSLQHRFTIFADDVDQIEHFALVIGEVKDGVKVRVHSECLTGDVFGSLRCDCGDQLDQSLKTFIEDKSGVLVYLRQEGRGIGLLNKLKAYELQEQGYDTVQANEMLGFKDDQRDYKLAGNILKSLGLKEIKLITNNPQKLSEISSYVKVIERISIECSLRSENTEYMKTKKYKLGHFLDSI